MDVLILPLVLVAGYVLTGWLCDLWWSIGDKNAPKHVETEHQLRPVRVRGGKHAAGRRRR